MKVGQLFVVIVLFCGFSTVFCRIHYGQKKVRDSLYFENPIIDGNDPDPGVVYVDGTYYATHTSVADTTGWFPIYSSTNKVDWKLVSYIFKHDSPPKWVNDLFLWAPEIHVIGSHYLACYAGQTKNGTLSVGMAWSDKILGPYTDLGQPLIYNASMGAIDPTVFYDEPSGNRYLFWKDDGNAIGQPASIWATLLTNDGKAVNEKNRTFIIQNDASSWEGTVVEAPWVYYRDGIYSVFYSGNDYATTSYAIGVAQSKNILGPYTKNSNNPILHSNTKWSGPGHCSVLDDPVHENKTIIFYHSWYETNIGGGYPRHLLMDSVYWDKDGWPYIDDDTPSTGSVPIP